MEEITEELKRKLIGTEMSFKYRGAMTKFKVLQIHGIRHINGYMGVFIFELEIFNNLDVIYYEMWTSFNNTIFPQKQVYLYFDERNKKYICKFN